MAEAVVDHREDVIDIAALVAQAGYLGLAAGLAFFVEPFSEGAFGQHSELEWIQGHTEVAFGFVVAVELLQVLVQVLGEGIDVFGGVVKLYEPVVAAAPVERHVDGGYSIVGDGGAAGFGGAFDRAIGIVDHDFFAEGIDVLLGPAGDADAVRVFGGKDDSIADQVAPQAAVGGDHQGVGLTDFYFAEGNGFGIRIVPLAFGDKFVEDPGIGEDHQPFLPVVGILGGEVSFRSIVYLVVGKAFGRKHLFKLGDVGAEADAAVHVYGGVGPDFFHVVFAGHLEDAAEQHECPGGYAGHDTHVFAAAHLGHDLDFAVPFGDQGGGVVGRKKRAADPRQVVVHDGGDITVADIRVVGFGDAARHHQVVIGECAHFGVAVVEQGERVPSGARVRVVEVLGGDGDKLAFIGGRPGGFGKPRDQSGPQDIGFAGHHAFDLGIDLVVAADGDLAGKIFVISDGAEAKRLSSLRSFGFLDEGHEEFVLEAMDLFFAVLQPCIQVGEVVGNGCIKQASASHIRTRPAAQRRTGRLIIPLKYQKSVKNFRARGRIGSQGAHHDVPEDLEGDHLHFDVFTRTGQGDGGELLSEVAGIAFGADGKAIDMRSFRIFHFNSNHIIL